MDLVWKLQPVTVSDLLEAVNQGRKSPIVRNTLQTQLKRLEAKGWLKRDNSGSLLLYAAAVLEQPGRIRQLTELRQRLFGGSSISMVRFLMEEGGFSENEIEELNQLIKNYRKGGES